MKNNICFFNYRFAIMVVILGICFSYIEVYSQNIGISRRNISIYSQGMAIVKETREFDLVKGENIINIQDIPEKIIPNSVRLESLVSIIEQNYLFDLANIKKIMNRFNGKEISLVSADTAYTGKLIFHDKEKIVLESQSGEIIIISNIEDFKLSVDNMPEDLISKPTLVWKIYSPKKQKAKIDFSYGTRGFSWQPYYKAILSKNDSTLDLKAEAIITNESGMAFKNAKINLVAGKVYDPDLDYELNRGAYDLKFKIATREFLKSFMNKSSAFLAITTFDIKRVLDIGACETKQIPLFSANNITFNKIYKALYITDESEYLNNSEAKPVKVVLDIANTKENNLGISLPEGVFSVSKYLDSNLVFLGEDKIKKTEPNAVFSVKVSNAESIRIKNTTKELENCSNEVGDYEIIYEIINLNPMESKKVEIIERVISSLSPDLMFNDTKLIVLSCNTEYEIVSATQVRLKFVIAPGAKKTINMKVRKIYDEGD